MKHGYQIVTFALLLGCGSVSVEAQDGSQGGAGGSQGGDGGSQMGCVPTGQPCLGGGPCCDAEATCCAFGGGDVETCQPGGC